MVSILFIAAVAAVGTTALAAPATKIPSANPIFGWSQTSSNPSPDHQVSVTIAVTHPEGVKERISSTLDDVSYGGAKYTQYLSRDEVVAMAAPVPESMTATLSWCAANQIDCTITGTGDLVKATAKASIIEQALNTKLSTFEHPRSQMPIVKSSDPVRIPAELEGHVDVIYGLDNFQTIFPIIPSDNVKVNSGAPQVTPDLLKNSLYNITEVATPGNKASMAVAEFQSQAYLPSDLEAFEQGTNLPMQKVRRVLGGNPGANESAGVEASLDIQYIIAAGTGVPTDFFLLESQAFDLLQWAGEVLNETDPALVWSVSYGEGVNGGINGVIPDETVQRLNTEMQKFGLQGLSVFVASGDSGVYSREPIKTEFHPSFPACLPAVTAVGATELNEDGSEDTGVSFSGGGFTPSNYYTRASAGWQNKSVSAYLSSGVKLPPSRDWDANGRGIPDVSAVGVDFKVWTGGHPTGVSGTSASTPVVAGIFGLVNNKLLAENKQPIGFANPFIYANQQAFRDIKKGFNNGGGLGIFSHGFVATTGWDPVTGVGTPLYPLVKEAAMNAQA